MLTFDQIKELARLVADEDLGGIELERAGWRVAIHGRDEVVAAPAAGAPAPTPLSAPALAAPPPGSGGPAEANGDESSGKAADAPHVLESPIVGTFYTAPSPDAPPFVEVGDTVTKGQIVCIVEAMKLMNEIEADVDGTVVEIYQQNAQPVDFGAPLFGIRPASD